MSHPFKMQYEGFNCEYSSVSAHTRSRSSRCAPGWLYSCSVNLDGYQDRSRSRRVIWSRYVPRYHKQSKARQRVWSQVRVLVLHFYRKHLNHLIISSNDQTSPPWPSRTFHPLAPYPTSIMCEWRHAAGTSRGCRPEARSPKARSLKEKSKIPSHHLKLLHNNRVPRRDA